MIHIQEVSDVEIIYVSADRLKESMMADMKESHGNWWAVEHDSDEAEAFKANFNLNRSGIPRLVVLDKNGKEVSKDGRRDVIIQMEDGHSAVDAWKKA